MTKTINRGHIKNKIKKGEYLARCLYHYTDDYAWDNENNHGKTDFMPAMYFPGYWLWLEETKPRHNYHLNSEETKAELIREYEQEKRSISAGIVFDENDLKTGSGRAYENEDGTITLAIHSNLVYELKKA